MPTGVRALSSVVNPTHSPTHLVAVIGSLRRASVNRTVFEAAVELLPPVTTLAEAALGDVPLYNGDLDGDEEPLAVAELKAAVTAADGLLFFTPEYNRSVPAVTKNALDWLSRPYGTGAMAGKPVGIVAATPGRHAGAGVREHLAQSAAILTERLFPDTLGLGRVFDAVTDGRLTDPEARARLADWLGRFVAHIAVAPAETPAP